MGPALRNHSSTVTRAARPVTLTCTALRTLTIAPRTNVGSGRIGSIHPCAAAGASGAVNRQTSPSRRDEDSMATGSCERRERDADGPLGCTPRVGSGRPENRYVTACEGVAVSVRTTAFWDALALSAVGRRALLDRSRAALHLPPPQPASQHG